MNILFLNELKTVGKVPQDRINLRSDFSTIQMLDAYHLGITELFNKQIQESEVVKQADFAIIVPSKTHPEYLCVLGVLKQLGIPFGIMQEGPNTFWEEWSAEYQLIYLDIIQQHCSVVLCHNEFDKQYFQGLTAKPIVVMPTVHNVKELKQLFNKSLVKAETVFIGGTVARWYNGMTAYAIVSEFPVVRIGFPTMRRIPSDAISFFPQIDNRVVHYPFTSLIEFLQELVMYKYAIHLMPNSAAGSFSLACAILGVPCIGNLNEDTQRYCFPELSVDINDTLKIKELFVRLMNDEEFYQKVRDYALSKVDFFDVNSQRDKVLSQLQEVLRERP